MARAAADLAGPQVPRRTRMGAFPDVASSPRQMPAECRGSDNDFDGVLVSELDRHWTLIEPLEDLTSEWVSACRLIQPASVKNEEPPMIVDTTLQERSAMGYPIRVEMVGAVPSRRDGRRTSQAP